MFKCKDLMKLPSLAKIQIVSGQSGLNNGIRWVYKPENMNFAKWVRGNELLIISTPVINSKDFNLLELVKKAVSLNMAGTLLLVGYKYIENISGDVIAYSNSKNFPLFTISGDTPLVDIFEEVGHAIAYDDKNNSSEEDLLSGIIFGNNFDENYFLLRCNELGINGKEFSQMFMFHLASEKLLKSFDYETVYLNITESFSNAGIPLLLLRYSNNFVGCMKAASNKKVIADLYEEIKAFINEKYPGWKVFMGVGRQYEELNYLQKSFDEASRCIILSEKLNKNQGLYWYDELGFYNLLFECKDEKHMDEFINGTLGLVMDYDKANNTDFLDTLKSYLWNNNSLLHAAEELNMHRNSVKYRVERIEEITGKDLNDPTTRLEFMNAILCKDICR